MPKQGGRSNYTMSPIAENVVKVKSHKSKSQHSDNKHGKVQNLESLSQAMIRESMQQSMQSSRYD